jgi:TonB-linked SusC/RagA family outer membrane protein
MKNNYGRFKIIALISLILLLSVITWKASAGNAPNSLENLYTQQEVTGVVTGPKGLPIAGVAVFIKGETKGTVTNVDGEFTIRATQGDTLVFTYLGFKPVEVVLDQESTLNIQMEEDVASLGEVEINAGYYNTTRRESTGNISRVTAEEIELQPVVSPLQALQGRMAGVEVLTQSGVPGNAPTIRIRGQNSLRNSFDDNGNLPLYIIDGVPINSSAIVGGSSMISAGIDPLSTLNLWNIKSIEVLKDADATAIYGSRGANGVILITTKDGTFSQKEIQIETQVYSGISKVSNKMELLNTEQYLKIRRAAFENDGVEPVATNAEDLVLWDQERFTDWQDKLFGGTSHIMDLNLAASGGTASTFFRIGGSYHTEGSVFPGDWNYQKATGSVNLKHQAFNDRLAINFTSNYGIDNNNLFHGHNFVQDALFLPPNAPAIYNEDGSLNWEDDTWDNPFALLANESTAKVSNLITNLGISYRLAGGLILKASAGYTILSSNQLRKVTKNSFSPDIRQYQNHSSTHYTTERESLIIEPQLIYNTKLGSGNLEGLLGVTFQQSGSRNKAVVGTGFPSESLIGNLGAAEEVSFINSKNIDYKYTAIFARLGYDWKQKYFINLTGRRDGSSRFGPDKRFANFGAIGGAWIFTEESIFNNDADFLSFGKIRGSYGTTGSDQIPDYGYLDAYEATPGPGGLYPTQLTNPDYSWEENKKLEAAIELGFFQDRMNLGVSWYSNRSSNQLVGYPLPSTTGFSSIQANLDATVQNTGWEFELSTLNIQTPNFKWQTFFNLTLPENKLIKFPGIEETSYANIYRVGYPLNISLLYKYNGIDTESGLYSIEDVNEDGRLDYEDRIVIKNLSRKFYGGLANNLTFRNFSLNFLWEFVKQEGPKPYFPNPGSLGNQPVDVYGASLGRDNSAEIQKFSQSFEAFLTYSDALDTNHFYGDASFLRLKNLSVQYNLPEKFRNQLGLTTARIFINGHNLFTVTDYKGLDPSSPGAVAIPSLRTITGGLQLNF